MDGSACRWASLRGEGQGEVAMGDSGERRVVVGRVPAERYAASVRVVLCRAVVVDANE